MTHVTPKLLRGWAEKFDANGALHADLLETADEIERLRAALNRADELLLAHASIYAHRVVRQALAGLEVD